MIVKLLNHNAELDKLIPVLLQLRPQYSKDSIKVQIEKQRKNGYQLAYVVDNEQILCVAGFVINEKLAWGKHIYVDDLVTAEDKRSTGAGKCVIDWLKAYGNELGCQQLHLDSGVQRFAAHKFYLRENFSINSHHFAIDNIQL